MANPDFLTPQQIEAIRQIQVEQELQNRQNIIESFLQDVARRQAGQQQPQSAQQQYVPVEQAPQRRPTPDQRDFPSYFLQQENKLRRNGGRSGSLSAVQELFGSGKSSIPGYGGTKTAIEELFGDRFA